MIGLAVLTILQTGSASCPCSAGFWTQRPDPRQTQALTPAQLKDRSLAAALARAATSVPSTVPTEGAARSQPAASRTQTADISRSVAPKKKDLPDAYVHIPSHQVGGRNERQHGHLLYGRKLQMIKASGLDDNDNYWHLGNIRELRMVDDFRVAFRAVELNGAKIEKAVRECFEHERTAWRIGLETVLRSLNAELATTMGQRLLGPREPESLACTFVIDFNHECTFDLPEDQAVARKIKLARRLYDEFVAEGRNSDQLWPHEGSHDPTRPGPNAIADQPF